MLPVCRYLWKPEEGIRSPEAGGLGYCELFDMDTKKWTQVPWESGSILYH